MAEQAKTTAAPDELDELAFQIFSQGVAANPHRSGEQAALDSYRKAEAFLAVRGKARKGELKPKAQEGPALADCRAPNLPRTHPHNLVSSVWGDLSKVRRIQQWLSSNPTPENDSEDLVMRLHREFPELSQWDMVAINTARVIFPAYAGKN